jgi:hypothetical protein
MANRALNHRKAVTPTKSSIAGMTANDPARVGKNGGTCRGPLTYFPPPLRLTSPAPPAGPLSRCPSPHLPALCVGAVRVYAVTRVKVRLIQGKELRQDDAPLTAQSPLVCSVRLTYDQSALGVSESFKCHPKRPDDDCVVHWDETLVLEVGPSRHTGATSCACPSHTAHKHTPFSSSNVTRRSPIFPLHILRSPS